MKTAIETKIIPMDKETIKAWAKYQGEKIPETAQEFHEWVQKQIDKEKEKFVE